MSDTSPDPRYRILSDEAVVVRGQTECRGCRARVEVICLYCQSGYVDGEPTFDFSISNVTHMDAALRLQLVKWPTYRPSRAPRTSKGMFVNHCSTCECPLEDFELHCRPDGVFFQFTGPGSQELEIHVLQGLIRVCGDESIYL